MRNKQNIVVIPADSRPVNYTLVQEIGSINKNINLLLPPRELLGGLKIPANTEKIFDWLEKTISQNKIDNMVCALDTIAYGGLIPSRWCDDSEQTILSRLKKFKQIIEQANCSIFAFSSVMRIANSNINEEEKPYWDKYGKLIFEYSCLKHKFTLNPDKPRINERLKAVKTQIPINILDDYLQTRRRNFSINMTYLDWPEDDVLDFLVYGKDDTAPSGLNVMEAQNLQEKITAKNLDKKAVLHTGSDEVISMLVSRAIIRAYSREISVFPIYSTPDGGNIVPGYEDRPLHKSLKTHFEILNLKQAESKEEADMLFLLHTPQKSQNDFALQEFFEPENPRAIDFCVELIKNSDKPVILADVCNANGSDKLLVKEIFRQNNCLKNIYGYAGWNTASNSIGSALSIGISRYIAEKQNNLCQKTYSQLLFVRFSDDWAYQSIARQEIRSQASEADEVLLYKKLIPIMDEIASYFSINTNRVILSYPWDRTFEVEINIL